MDDSCSDLLTEATDDDARSDDSCDETSVSHDEPRDEGEDCDERDADSCEDDHDECTEVRAPDDDCAAADDTDECGGSLSAVPDDTSTSPEPASTSGVDIPLPDSGAVAPLIPVDIPVPERIADFEAIPGIGGDTAAVLGSVSGQLADAGRIAHAPLTGAGASDPELAGALARANTAGRAAAALTPFVQGEEMRADVNADEFRRQSLFAARKAEGEAALLLERGESLLGDP